MFSLKLLFADKKFWISSLSIWGIVWAIAEGVLFSLQLAGIASSHTLGYLILIIFVCSFLLGGFLNRPFRPRTQILNSTGVKITLKFGNIWRQKGDKIIAVTRCFSTAVDDTVIHSQTLHGMFINRNFRNNNEAKLAIDSKLDRARDESDPPICNPGQTIKIKGKKDSAFLVGLTTLDENYKASVSPNEFFLALANLWETLKQQNNSSTIVCPLIGSGRSRLNFNNTAIFCEVLNSALIAMKNGFITNELVLIIHPSDVEQGTVNIEELENTLATLCEYENLHRMTVEGYAEEI